MSPRTHYDCPCGARYMKKRGKCLNCGLKMGDTTHCYACHQEFNLQSCVDKMRKMFDDFIKAEIGLCDKEGIVKDDLKSDDEKIKEL